MTKIAVYAGSFDPPTNGHLWMIEQGSKMFDQLIVAVAVNPEKKYSFDIDQRFDWLQEIVGPFATHYGAELCTIGDSFLVDFAQQMKASYILRGIRNEGDFLYERSMRNVNGDLHPDIQTVFLMPPRNLCEISSSLVKGLVGPRDWRRIVRNYVPECVFRGLEKAAETDH